MNTKIKSGKTLQRSLLGGLLCFALQAYADKIEVKGLLKNMVVLEVNGSMRTLRAGQTSPEGITLIRSDQHQAVVEVQGKQHTLTLSRTVGGVEYQAPEKEIVRIPSGRGGHYSAPGRINNKEVSVLVDTGATTVAMNSQITEQLGIDYKHGERVMVSTASGSSQGYKILLNSVSVGSVTVHNVEAIIITGAYPQEILLGNSYLAKVDFKVESGVLILQSKY